MDTICSMAWESSVWLPQAQRVQRKFLEPMPAQQTYVHLVISTLKPGREHLVLIWCWMTQQNNVMIFGSCHGSYCLIDQPGQGSCRCSIRQTILESSLFSSCQWSTWVQCPASYQPWGLYAFKQRSTMQLPYLPLISHSGWRQLQWYPVSPRVVISNISSSDLVDFIYRWAFWGALATSWHVSRATRGHMLVDTALNALLLSDV